MPITGPSIFFSSSFAKLVARKARAATLHMVLPARRPKAEDMRPNICCWSPHGCSVCQRVGHGLMEFYRSYIYIYDFQSQPFKSCGPLPTTMLCSFAHLHNELHAGTTVVLLPKGSFLLWVVAKPKLLRRNGRVSWSGAPKLAQILVGKCGQIWDNANRYTKYKICVKICHSMLHMSYVWNNPLNFQTKINIYQHVSFLIFDVRIQQIKPWGTATRSCHWWCPCSPAWRTSATVWKSGRTGVILQLGHDKRNGKHVELWKRVQRHETSFLISSK